MAILWQNEAPMGNESVVNGKLCKFCGGPLPSDSKKDKQFCNGTCRSKDSRLEKLRDYHADIINMALRRDGYQMEVEKITFRKKG